MIELDSNIPMPVSKAEVKRQRRASKASVVSESLDELRWRYNRDGEVLPEVLVRWRISVARYRRGEKVL